MMAFIMTQPVFFKWVTNVAWYTYRWEFDSATNFDPVLSWTRQLTAAVKSCRRLLIYLSWQVQAAKVLLLLTFVHLQSFYCICWGRNSSDGCFRHYVKYLMFKVITRDFMYSIKCQLPSGLLHSVDICNTLVLKQTTVWEISLFK